MRTGAYEPLGVTCLCAIFCGVALSLTVGCSGLPPGMLETTGGASSTGGQSGAFYDADAAAVGAHGGVFQSRDGGTCAVTIEQHPPASSTHVTSCSPVAYDTNPPSGGDHYPDWAAFQTYDFPVPEGFLVHSMEHGAVVFWYNCPSGCDQEVAAAKAMIDALPPDDACIGCPTSKRVILTPNPDLTVRWAASAWGVTLGSDCFDPTEYARFYEEHFGQGREQECAAGLAIMPDTCQ